MIYIYNTIGNFNLVATRRSESEISAVIYSKEMKRIILGGSFLQIWSLKNFQVEVQSKKLESYVGRIFYVPSSDIIVTEEGDCIGVYNRNLACLSRLPIPYKKIVPAMNMLPFEVSEMTIVSRDLLLLCVQMGFPRAPKTFLVNLKKKTFKEHSKIFIADSSCVVMIEETPKKVLTCLISDPAQGREYDYDLAQLTIDEGREELVVEKMAKDLPLLRLFQMENCKYFVAEEDRGNILLLNIRKDKVEVFLMISVILEDFMYHGLMNLILLKNESSIVVFSRLSGAVYLFRLVRSHDQKKKDII